MSEYNPKITPTYKEMGLNYSKGQSTKNPNLEDQDVRIVHKDVKTQEIKRK